MNRYVREGWERRLIGGALDRRDLEVAAAKGVPFECEICGNRTKPGEFVWVKPNKKGDRYIHEHFSCVDQIRDNEAKETEVLLSNPWAIERAAKASGLTLGQFANLPRYARESKLRSQNYANQK